MSKSKDRTAFCDSELEGLGEAAAEAILRTVLDAVIAINERGIIELVNPAAVKLFGYDEGEIVGQNIRMLMPNPYAAEHDGYLERYLKTGERKIIGIGREVVGLRKDGTEFPVELAVTETRLGDRQVFTGIVRDITEWVEARDALRLAREKLEERVVERTKQLAEANAVLKSEISARIKGQERVQNALKEKEVLLKEVHHRVKNNLQLISSLLKLHVRRSRGASGEEIAQEIHNRIQSIALLHEMLYRDGDFEKVHFPEYAEKLASNVSRYLGGTGLIDVEVVGQSIFLNLEQSISCGLILNELITNSIKHAFPDRRQGKVRIEMTESPAGTLRICISDNGVGLPKNLDFKNTDSLGLELVRKLSKQLGGEISLEGGTGTTATLSFPMQGV